jgi:hypothetical protein
MQYDHYSDKELLEVYKTMNEYSGKVEPAVADSIARRGGLEQMQQREQERLAVPTEIQRIHTEVAQLRSQGKNVLAIKAMVRSELLNPEQLDAALAQALAASKTQEQQKKWTARVVLGCLAGWAISTLLGAALWVWIVLCSGKIYYGLSIVVVLAGYGICRILAGRKHPLVFLAAFLAGCTAIVLGLWACAQLLGAD